MQFFVHLAGGGAHLDPFRAAQGRGVELFRGNTITGRDGRHKQSNFYEYILGNSILALKIKRVKPCEVLPLTVKYTPHAKVTRLTKLS
jgi:hypothetical protein